MRGVTGVMDRIKRTAGIVAAGAIATLVIVAGVVYWLWQDRLELDEIPIHAAALMPTEPEIVTTTWFGTSMLLFDDGETQILIDGFVTRPPLLRQVLDQAVESHAAEINRFMLDYRLDRLAAIIPAHTHFDHALDIAAIANRSRASIVGSPSAVLIGRGQGVPDDQLVAVGDRTEFQFGEFTVTLVPSRHAAFGWNGSVPMAGPIMLPFAQPAPISAYRADLSFSIVVAHPQGTSVVQASAGFVPEALDDVTADVVFLGVGMLETMGREYAEEYWRNVVSITGATRVIPVHFDDYTAPFGTTRLPPRIIDDLSVTAGWLDQYREIFDRGSRLEMPVFGAPMPLYLEPATTGT